MRLASRVLCDKKIPPRLKGKFYRVVVRPALLYGAECWPVKNAHVQKIHIAKMRMLRWIEGGSGLYGGQTEGSETEMVWTCEDTVRRHPSEEVRGVGCRGKLPDNPNHISNIDK
ncbi:hypothetical protein H5410_004316 [Solanum commersonii]|uniref:Uncharacterized protein n=1 Tax=Solanum commersonii TaxID=4109 RepID=A0A9J6B849_SOLCO|nr:hypothetical protein H5410_004316 [Solanum commersonii]